MSSGATLSIFISNIPENFSEADVYALLSQAGVAGFKEREKVRISKNRGSGTETGRYMVVQFDSADHSAAAIDALSNINLMINQKPHQIYFSPFIQDLAKRIKAKTGMMVVQNLPKDVTVSGLRSVFSTFGTVLSAKLVVTDTRPKNSDDKTQQAGSAMGYVMFLSDEEADRAVKETNGKFLGVNKVTSSRYLSAEERVDSTTSIFFKNIPPELADDLDAFRKLISDIAGEPVEDVLDQYYLTNISMKKDNRPEPYRTENSWCVVKAKDADLVKEIIDGFTKSEMNQNIQACKFLSRGLRLRQLKMLMRENYTKYVASKRNISIYGLSTSLDREAFEKKLKSLWKSDDVEEIMFPPDALSAKLDPSKFHVNVLFSTADLAKDAIQKLNDRGLLKDFIDSEGAFKVDYYELKPQTRLFKQGAPKGNVTRAAAFPAPDAGK